MTILTLNRKELEKKIGKIDEKIENRISMFGTPIDSINDNEISIEVFPNRPDLLSLHGFTRSFLAFLGKDKGLINYRVEKPLKDYRVVIEKSVKKVRPYTACAIVKGIKFDESKIREIIELQEKLHASYGRNRKKLAIGIYPLEEIRLPITFLARNPEKIAFQPLDFPKIINAKQILSKHPKGKEYGYLLKDCEVYPIFEDSKGEILSMPPIINSEKTGKITEKTKDVFIECSGFNKEYLDKTLNIIVSVLSDFNGRIYAVEIEDKGERKKYLSPNLKAEKITFSPEFLNKNLGMHFNENEIKENLSKMGIGYSKEKNKYYALIPSYRTDILHEIDLAEEIAIAYGYENFEAEIPAISTIGEESKTGIIKRKISEVLIGSGLLEISSYHLSTKEKQFKKIGYKDFRDKLIEVVDSKTERNILRDSLLANSIEILSENTDVSYPQKIFEVGTVFYSNKNAIEEEERLCISLCHEKANFTEIKQVLEYLLKMFTLSYEMKESSHPSFIDGRCGEIIVNNKKVGIIGEIHPSILYNNKIFMPVASLEIETRFF
ncbi:phenylalanine--tRNA ligase subunit beta [Candidatus Pacearchaeota archaeon]|nr:phenylalanine--tRNA ligase subunit beta [Candidatus Pacearchaeota archaeon]